MTQKLRFPLALAAALLAAACTPDAAAPTFPEPDAPRSGTGLAGPKGYGFRMLSNIAASAILDGTRSVRCTDSGYGYAIFELTLTARMVEEMEEVLGLGGSVFVQVITQHTFTGEGNYSYWELLGVLGPTFQGSHSNEASVSNPGRPSQVTEMVFETPISAGQLGGLSAGSVINVALRARTEGDLGAYCGQIAGGQAAWRMRGAVLWLVP